MKTVLIAASVVCVALGIAVGVPLFLKTEHAMLSSAEGVQGSSSKNSMQNILTDRQLWGEDAFAVFANLQHWKDAGETSIQVFPDRVVGGRKQDTATIAQQTVARLSSAMRRAQPKLRAEYQAAYQPSLPRAMAFKFQAEKFMEDDSFRVVLRREAGEFLKKGITIRTLMDRFGQPEKTTTEVIQTEGDRRPPVLTVYWYANGAVKFVQSDFSPTPGAVDRVVLDTGMVASQLH
jgi:hypothetical protein